MCGDLLHHPCPGYCASINSLWLGRNACCTAAATNTAAIGSLVLLLCRWLPNLPRGRICEPTKLIHGDDWHSIHARSQQLLLHC